MATDTSERFVHGRQSGRGLVGAGVQGVAFIGGAVQGGWGGGLGATGMSLLVLR